MTNGERAKQIIDKYGFDFNHIPKDEVVELVKTSASRTRYWRPSSSGPERHI